MSSLQLSIATFQDKGGRVHDASVNVAQLGQGKQGGRMLAVLEDVGRRTVDGWMNVARETQVLDIGDTRHCFKYCIVTHGFHEEHPDQVRGERLGQENSPRARRWYQSP